MDNQFQEGMQVKSIYWDDGPGFIVGQLDCKQITVIMENGQMAGVPWFLVEFEDKPTQKINGALVEGVELLPANPTN